MESGGRAASSDEEEDVRSPGAAEEAAHHTGAGRPYYECVFCKRGFTAAQALGGHMNIHRRDRASKSAGVDAPTADATPASVSWSTAECYGKNRHMGYSQAPPVMQPASSYPGAAASAGDGEDGEAVSTTPTELSLFAAADDAHHEHDHDLRLGLGCYGRGGGGGGGGPERQDGEPELKLDLELRLGRVVPGIE